MPSLSPLARPCALLFVAAVCFTALAQSPKGLPEALNRFSREVYIPTLPKGMRETASVDLSGLDTAFDTIIAGYSPATRLQLREVYYGGLQLEDKPGLISGSRSFGEAQLTKDGSKTSFKVTIDPLIRKCPGLFRLTLIHEVAVHVGQWLERISQVGIETYLAQNQSQEFGLFSELSAHAAEKRVLDRIPLATLEKEIQSAFSDPALREDLLTEMRFRRRAKFENYIWLRMRVAYAKQSSLPHLSEYQIREFLQIYEAKEALKNDK